jgi:protein-L-isoaspartate(D-aspartate) O-methyltransferase
MTNKSREVARQLATQGVVTNERILQAFEMVDRHHFVPEASESLAYSDRSVPVAGNSCSSRPYIMARMLEQADIRSGESVLELGTGTGYNAALLSQLVGPDGHVVSVDIEPKLVQDAAHRLKEQGFTNVNAIVSDGQHGYRRFAPYDVILGTFATADVPSTWAEQVRPGGRMVLPIVLAANIQVSAKLHCSVDAWSAEWLEPCLFIRQRGAQDAFTASMREIWNGRRVYLVAERVASLAQGVVDMDPCRHTALAQVNPHSLWGLHAWLATRRPDVVGIQYLKHGLRVERDAVYELERISRQSGIPLVGLVSKNGMALLLQEQSAHPGSYDGDQQVPFSLDVGVWGDGDDIAAELEREVGAWASKGSPGSAQMRLELQFEISDPTLAGDTAVGVIRRATSTIRVTWE